MCKYVTCGHFYFLLPMLQLYYMYISTHKSIFVTRFGFHVEYIIFSRNNNANYSNHPNFPMINGSSLSIDWICNYSLAFSGQHIYILTTSSICQIWVGFFQLWKDHKFHIERVGGMGGGWLVQVPTRVRASYELDK